MKTFLCTLLLTFIVTVPALAQAPVLTSVTFSSTNIATLTWTHPTAYDFQVRETINPGTTNIYTTHQETAKVNTFHTFIWPHRYRHGPASRYAVRALDAALNPVSPWSADLTHGQTAPTARTPSSVDSIAPVSRAPLATAPITRALITTLSGIVPPNPLDPAMRQTASPSLPGETLAMPTTLSTNLHFLMTWNWFGDILPSHHSRVEISLDLKDWHHLATVPAIPTNIWDMPRAHHLFARVTAVDITDPPGTVLTNRIANLVMDP